VTAAYSPALLSAMLHATADNLDSTPVALVVEEALRTAHARGDTGALALTAITWALRDTAELVSNIGN
jgi:hypothetical protein